MSKILKAHHKLHKIPARTPEWHLFRRRSGLGGSDVGAAVGDNPYFSRWHLWETKVGLRNDNLEPNEKILHGLIDENQTAKLWGYYDGYVNDSGVPTYVDRYMQILENPKDRELRTLLRQRRSERVNGVVTHSSYPWLFMNLDRIIPAGQFSFKPGRVPLETHAPLECKSMGEFVGRHYDESIPPYYHSQGHSYMILLDTDYVEFAVRLGLSLQVKPFLFDRDYADRLLAETYDFWHRYVVPAQAYMERREQLLASQDYRGAEIIEGQMREHEPPPDGTSLSLDYRKERIAVEQGGTGDRKGDQFTATLDNTHDMFSLGIELLDISSAKKVTEAKETKIKDEMLAFFRNTGMNKLDFGASGYISYYPNKNGVFTLRNQIKV
ncbi:MAG TPA: hypothetical protein DCG24_02880 [Bacteroidetes bacterium]|nr:YqaJ viral recombinase family protein [Chitinophagales bacterium]HAE13146.1 hypothetical protein [Bacteroidota bacterium]HAE35278.1 hypothetical protein [Bacteroidota bacterium]HQU38759.1 YqaJ viral recombinase family protein [Chitinophagales bacterium]HQU76605.1 YqaJ viral recombinase family protein [Chitinophagales bacterium]